MVTKKLHFKVCGEGLTDLVRQIYLYEDKEKAWNIMATLNGLSIDQAKSVFLGDAEFITPKVDDGTISFVKKENKKWKKELDEHIKFLKKQREEELKDEENKIKQLKYVYDDEEEDDIPDEPDELLEKLQRQANIDIAKQSFVRQFYTNNKEEKEALKSITETFANKMYSFVFQGHQYTFNDSARNQSECPHCRHKSKNNYWSVNEEGYLGYYDFGTKEVAICFECPHCFDKFYHHEDKNRVLRKLEEKEND